ncbi:MAG: amidohydrolase family protein [Vicinamibacterales bacterium]
MIESRWTTTARALSIGLLIAAAYQALDAQPDVVYDRVVVGGRVIDPASGLDAIRNVGIRDGRIAAVSTSALRGRDTVDARGLVVAPGFIDPHAHGQTSETYRYQSLDGVTTSLELEVGTATVDRWYDERKGGRLINYGVSIGHIPVRMTVLHDSGSFLPVDAGAYKAASPAEIQEIVRRVDEGLAEGAVSMGAGLTYTPAATHEELLAVFGVGGRTGTTVHVHIRRGVDGLNEALALAAESKASLHIVHINSAGNAETPAMLRLIAEARRRGQDVTTEAYPYDAGMTEIQSATVQDEYRASGNRFSEIEWPLTGERLNAESFARYSQIGGPVVIHSNTEAMVALAISSPLTMIGSDAYWQNGTGHPRTTGTHARVLGRYVRETHSITLMEAVAKMTLMPAQRLEARVPALKRKGRLTVGSDADLTIFDAQRVSDRSTYGEPSLPPVGIQHVIVNGVSVVSNGRAVEGVAPGAAVRAPLRRR